MTGKQGLEGWQQQEPGVYSLHLKHWAESKPEVPPRFSSQSPSRDVRPPARHR